MKPIRQLLRQPIKTVIGVLLLTLATAALCVCVGQHWTAAQTREAVDQKYTTVASITDYYEYDHSGYDKIRKLWEQPPEVVSYMAELPKRLPQAVQQVTHNRLVSAYIPEMTAIPSNTVYAPDNGFTASHAYSIPYWEGFFEIELTEVGAPIAWQEKAYWQSIGGRSDDVLYLPLSGTVVRTLSLNPYYDDPAGREANIALQIDSPEDPLISSLEAGKRYLIYASFYFDTDWDLRKTVASFSAAFGVKPENIDWEKDLDTSFAGEGESVSLPGTINNGRTLGILKPVGENGERIYSLYFTELDAEKANSSLFEVISDPLSLMARSNSGSILVTQGEETVEIPPEQWLERYDFPDIQEITATAEDILENDPLWKKAAEELEIRNHAFPVLGVDRLEALTQFVGGKALVTEGRTFTAEEYRKGKPVCVISETMAQESGLNVGDSITLNFYESDKAAPYQAYIGSASNPCADYYYSVNGFAQEGQFEIVGLYRQTKEWSAYVGDISPITVLVPSASIRCQAFTADDGVFSTVLLKNGTGDDLLADAEAAGFPELFGILDQGYSEIAGALDGYAKAAGSVLWIGIGIFLAVTALYLILYPLAMGKQSKQMWTLGTPRGEIFKNLLLSGGFPAILGGFLAIPLAVVGNRYLHARLTQGGEGVDFAVSVTTPQLTLLCLLSTAALLLLTALCACLITRRGED